MRSTSTLGKPCAPANWGTFNCKQPTGPGHSPNRSEFGFVACTAALELIPKVSEIFQAACDGLVCSLSGESYVCSQVFGVLKNWKTCATQLPSHFRVGWPCKGFLTIYRQVGELGEGKQGVQLFTCGIWVPCHKIPIVNKTEHPQSGVLGCHEPVHDIIEEQHTKTRHGTTLCKASASNKTWAIGVTDLETPCHGC